MTDLKQRIETAIVNRIFVGEYHSGEILKEESIAAEFSASRTPVREVLATIVANGQATYIFGRGTSVPNLDLQATILLLEALELIAPINTRLAAERIGNDQFQRLSQLVDNMRAHSIDGSIPAFVLEHWNWVQVISRGSGNPYLSDAILRIAFQVHRLRTLAMRQWPESRIIAQKQRTLSHAGVMTSSFLTRSIDEVTKLVTTETGNLRREIASTLWGH